jgi:hypothetical protein
MADCDRNRIPKRWNDLNILSVLNSIPEITNKVCEVGIKKMKVSLNEIATIVAPRQKQIVVESDFNRVSNPIFSEYAKTAYREFYDKSPNENLDSYVLTIVMILYTNDTLFDPIKSDSSSGNETVIQHIIEASRSVPIEYSRITDSILKCGKVIIPPKRKNIDMYSYSLN